MSFQFLHCLVRSSICVVGVLFLPMTSYGQNLPDYRGMDARMERLEQDLKDIQRFVYRPGGTGAATGQAATSQPEPARITPNSGDPVSVQIADRLFQLEKDLRQLTGEVERIVWQMDQVTGRMDKLVKDVDFRLRALEQSRPAGSLSSGTSNLSGQPPAEGGLPRSGAEPGINMASNGGSGTLGTIPIEQAPQPLADTDGIAPAAPVETTALQVGGVLPPGDAKAQYSFAAALMARGDYTTARAAFVEFLEIHPEDVLAGNAQYWLGETYYTEKNFAKAAENFLIGMQKYGDGPKGPDNMLKLGMTLLSLEQKDEACTTLTALPGRYPNAPTNILSRAENEREKVKCP